MKSKPILFSTPMVKAILLGKKTQTRRIVKGLSDDNDNLLNDGKIRQFLLDTCPYGQKNDELWVREKFAPKELSEEPPGQYYHYYEDDPFVEIKWKPSIFMPRIASRITLQVERVELQRLQDISEEDAIREGILSSDMSNTTWYYDYQNKDFSTTFPVISYRSLWEEINGKMSWDENPWVYVLEFKQKGGEG